MIQISDELRAKLRAGGATIPIYWSEEYSDGETRGVLVRFVVDFGKDREAWAGALWKGDPQDIRLEMTLRAFNIQQIAIWMKHNAFSPAEITKFCNAFDAEW